MVASESLRIGRAFGWEGVGRCAESEVWLREKGLVQGVGGGRELRVIHREERGVSQVSAASEEVVKKWWGRGEETGEETMRKQVRKR